MKIRPWIEFLDSVTMTLADFEREWDNWSYWEKMLALPSLVASLEAPNILRFVIQNGAPDDWSNFAVVIASRLPREEAYSFILKNCHTAERVLSGGSQNTSA